MSADALLAKVRAAFDEIPDHRREKSPIPLGAALMSAFAMFALKDPSLLAFDQRRNDTNMKRLFGIERIPSDTQMREILDPLEPDPLRPVFRAVWQKMGVGELRCLKPANLDREIAVAILAYNLVRVLMSDAALVSEVHPREISFSRARDAWISFRDELKSSADLMWIILSATSRLVRDRPGRDEPRAIERRQTKYDKLKTPRPSRIKPLPAADTSPSDKPP